jgi:hypothetical protein
MLIPVHLPPPILVADRPTATAHHVPTRPATLVGVGAARSAGHTLGREQRRHLFPGRLVECPVPVR